MSVIGHKALGVDLDGVHTTAQHPVGLRVSDDAGNTYQYVKAGGTVAALTPVKIATGYVATVSGNAGIVYGVSQSTALAANDYAFIMVQGVTSVNCNAAVGAGDALGLLSDANGDITVDADTTAAQTVRAIALTAHSAGFCNVQLL